MNWFKRVKKLVCANCYKVYKGKLNTINECTHCCETGTIIKFKPHRMVKNKYKGYPLLCNGCQETAPDLERWYGKDWKKIDHCTNWRNR